MYKNVYVRNKYPKDLLFELFWYVFNIYTTYIFEIYRDKPLEVCTGYTEDRNHLTRFIALRTCINVNHY